jgi:hypothetical protein
MNSDFFPWFLNLLPHFPQPLLSFREHLALLLPLMSTASSMLTRRYSTEAWRRIMQSTNSLACQHATVHREQPRKQGVSPEDSQCLAWCHPSIPELRQRMFFLSRWILRPCSKHKPHRHSPLTCPTSSPHVQQTCRGHPAASMLVSSWLSTSTLGRVASARSCSQ